MDVAQVLAVSTRYERFLDDYAVLPLAVRTALIDELGEGLSQAERRQHFWRLSLRCAQRVYFRWVDRYPEIDLRPVYGKLTQIPEVNQFIEALAVFHQSLKGLEPDTSPANQMAMDAAMAIWAAARDTSFGQIPRDGRTDEEQVVESRTVEHFAVNAYAGRPEAGVDIARRRKFWLWYLHEAAPEAYTNYVAPRQPTISHDPAE